MNEAKKIYDSYNLLKWMIPIIAKYPRKWRYSLGLRIENRRYDNLEPDNRNNNCLLYTSPSPRDRTRSRMPSSA